MEEQIVESPVAGATAGLGTCPGPDALSHQEVCADDSVGSDQVDAGVACEAESAMQLSTKQLRLVAALVSDTNIQAACQTADVSRAAAYQWMKQPAFQDELKRRRNAVLGEALANVKINATRAAAALVGLLDEDDPSLRRLVCRDILDRAIRIHDMEDIQTRLTAMEKVLKQQSGARP